MAVTRPGLCTGLGLSHLRTSAADRVGETLQGPENANTCFNQESDFYRT